MRRAQISRAELEMRLAEPILHLMGQVYIYLYKRGFLFLVKISRGI